MKKYHFIALLFVGLFLVHQTVVLKEKLKENLQFYTIQLML